MAASDHCPNATRITFVTQQGKVVIRERGRGSSALRRGKEESTLSAFTDSIADLVVGHHSFLVLLHATVRRATRVVTDCNGFQMQLEKPFDSKCWLLLLLRKEEHLVCRRPLCLIDTRCPLMCCEDICPTAVPRTVQRRRKHIPLGRRSEGGRKEEGRERGPNGIFMLALPSRSLSRSARFSSSPLPIVGQS